MIDWGYEARLHDQITLREAVDTLNQRQRDVLAMMIRHGMSGREAADELGLSQTRVYQIYDRAVRHLRARLRQTEPRLIAQPSKPKVFDRAAFLDHMRWLIAEREKAKAREKQRTFERELDVLQQQIDHEVEEDNYVKKLREQREREERERRALEEQHRARREAMRATHFTNHRMYVMAQEALHHLLFFRQPQVYGLADIGQTFSSVTYSPETGSVLLAMQKLAAHIPLEARLSAVVWTAPFDTRVAYARNEFCGLRLREANDGLSYQIDVTWTLDDGPA